MDRQKKISPGAVSNERGAEITEFGIYAALIIAGAIVLMSPIGNAVVRAYQQISTAVASV